MTSQSNDMRENYRGVFDGHIGFGRKSAILSIDFMKAYTDPNSPFFAEGVVEATRQAAQLYAAARAAGVPIFYTNVNFMPDGRNGGVFVEKVPALRRLTSDSELAELDPVIAPHPGEPVICKQYPSAFFGTPLVSMLVSQGVDTVIITGCSTSGCVRASAVDAISYGFRVIVPRECVGDRHAAPHEANLFDIQAKYGEVLAMNEVIAAISRQKVN